MQQDNLTRSKKRAFQAQVCIDYLNSKAYLAERVFLAGIERQLTLGLNEVTHGERLRDHFKARGNKKTKQKTSMVNADIVALAEPESQVDPKFQTRFKYTRMTAKAMRQALITERAGTMKSCRAKDDQQHIEPLRFRLRRVQKAKP